MNTRNDTPSLDTDPALIAAEEDARAAAAFSAIGDNAVGDYEETSEWKAAQERIGETGGRFADAVPTTAAGALAKMKFLAEGACISTEPDDDSFDDRHVRTIMEYLEQVSGESANPETLDDVVREGTTEGPTGGPAASVEILSDDRMGNFLILELRETRIIKRRTFKAGDRLIARKEGFMLAASAKGRHPEPGFYIIGLGDNLILEYVDADCMKADTGPLIVGRTVWAHVSGNCPVAFVNKPF